jgi:hypothetical protein
VSIFKTLRDSNAGVVRLGKIGLEKGGHKGMGKRRKDGKEGGQRRK